MTKLAQTLIATVILALVISLCPVNAEKAEHHPSNVGEKYFRQYCANCHIGGNNVVNPKHPVAESKILITLATFKSYLSAPPGHMPAYKEVVNNPQILEPLYQYCKQLKKGQLQLSKVENIDF